MRAARFWSLLCRGVGGSLLAACSASDVAALAKVAKSDLRRIGQICFDEETLRRVDKEVVHEWAVPWLLAHERARNTAEIIRARARGTGERVIQGKRQSECARQRRC